jgi:hypothetical protein
MVYLGFVTKGESKEILSAVLTGISAYSLLIIAGALLLAAWAIYAQISLFSAVLNVSRFRTAVAHIGMALLLLAIVFAFPPLMTGLFGVGFSEAMTDMYKPLFE